MFYKKYVFSDILKYGMFMCFHLITILYMLNSLRLLSEGNNFKQNREVFCLPENYFVW